MQVGTTQLSGLQSAIEAARLKNSSLRPAQNTNGASNTSTVKTAAKTGKAIADVSIKSGKLVDRFYGNETKKQEQTPILIGSRFDTYA